MNTDLLNAKYAAELRFIERTLKEANFTTQFLDVSKEIPMPMLVVHLTPDERGRERFIHMLFVPASEEELQTVQFLQLYAPLPFSPGKYTAELPAFLLGANNQIAIGHLGFDPNGSLCYRYVHVKEKYRMIDAGLVREMVEVFFYMIDRVSPLIEQVAGGQMSAAEAIQKMNG